MKMFESFNKKSSGGNLNGWQSLMNERKAPVEKEKSPEELMRERESRLINVLMTGDPAKFDEKDPTDSLEDRKMVLDGIKDGRITKTYWDRTLACVPGPLDENPTADVFVGMYSDKHARRILASMTGEGFEGYGAVNNKHLGRFIEKFPSPADFDGEAEHFLGMIREGNPESKYREYVRSMDKFKHLVYGEKQDYWDAAKELIAEAGAETADEAGYAEVDDSNVSEQERRSHERQARKLVGAIVTGDRRVIGERDYPATLSDLEKVYDKINNGEMSARSWDAIISNIRSPMMEYSSAGLMDLIQGDERKMRILSRVTGRGFNNFRGVGPQEMHKFTKEYDTPIKFDFVSQQMLRTIEMSVPEPVYRSYEEAMHEFKDAMYGKQQEYWDAAKRLEKAAGDYRRNGNRHSADDDEYTSAVEWDDGGVYGPDDPDSPFHEVR